MFALLLQSPHYKYKHMIVAKSVTNQQSYPDVNYEYDLQTYNYYTYAM